jgi:long-subunit fatty acid transport protein
MKNNLIFTFICVTLFFYSVVSVFAQDNNNEDNRIKYNYDNPSKPFKDRIFTGGNVGLQLGTVTMVDISPLIGYKLTEKLTTGVGFTYQYYNDSYFAPPFTLNIWGGRIFVRYNILERLFAHVEYEFLTFKTDMFNMSSNEPAQQINLNNILIGGGYRERIGEDIYANVTVLWNINESAYSLYRNPIIRLGFVFGL